MTAITTTLRTRLVHQVVRPGHEELVCDSLTQLALVGKPLFSAGSGTNGGSLLWHQCPACRCRVPLKIRPSRTVGSGASLGAKIYIRPGLV